MINQSRIGGCKQTKMYRHLSVDFRTGEVFVSQNRRPIWPNDGLNRQLRD